MPTYEVQLPGGKKWIGPTSNMSSAIKRAFDEVYRGTMPTTVTLTVIRHEGGAVVLDPPQAQE